ncbi:MAG: hypothetical protein ACRD4H_08205 [Candidatus Acidiferrales bacterium]
MQVQGRPDDLGPRAHGRSRQSGAYCFVAGQRHGTAGAAPLIEDIAFGGLIAGKPFASNWIIADMNAIGAKIVISQRPQRKHPFDIDLEIYKWRHLIENFLCKLKEFRRIAMLSGKTGQSFKAIIYIASAVINSR